jgi:hypothetical protein
VEQQIQSYLQHTQTPLHAIEGSFDKLKTAGNMKLIAQLLVLTFSLLACGRNTKESPLSITGEWDLHSTIEGKPWLFTARFKPDGVIDGIGNGKLVISMSYKVSGDTIYFTGDPSCIANSVGVYKLTYFKDSVQFNMVEDTCSIRIANTDKVRLGRVSENGQGSNGM